ncbi:MAG: hypothetical protein V4724_32685 [Pseudomonadota bacterium]
MNAKPDDPTGPAALSRSAPPPAHPAGALEALADSLSACADELHARIMKAVRNRGQTPHDALQHEAAQALFDSEVALRQRANALYLNAAVLAASGLGAPRQELLDLVALARQQIRRIDVLKDLLGVAADVLGLAAALADAKPEHVPAAVADLRKQLARLREDRAS